MKTPLVLVGVIVLIVGLAFLGYGPSATTTNTSTATTTQNVAQNSQRTIDGGGTWSFGVNMQQGESLHGSISIQSYNATAGPIFFYVQNESTYINWGGCAPCDAVSAENYTLPSSGTYQFSWTAPKTAAYYLTFDDENYGQSAPATFSATGTLASVSTTTSNNQMYTYLGAVIAIVGVAILGAGFIAGGSKSSPKKTETAVSQRPTDEAKGTQSQA